jgi:hypothetical protein
MPIICHKGKIHLLKDSRIDLKAGAETVVLQAIPEICLPDWL